MATDFTNNGKTILSSGGFQPSVKNTPLDSRTRVNLKADIDSIPNPFVGMHIIVLQDEDNNNEMTEYVVKSLKANSLGVADAKINEVVLIKDFLNVSTSGGNVDLTGYVTKTELNSALSTKANTSDIPSLNEYATKTELNEALSTKANTSDIPSLDGYATETFVTNKIAEASLSGGEVDLSGYATKDELNAKVNVSDLSNVAISGDYNDLINKPESQSQLVTACEPQATDVPKVFFNGEFPTTKASVTMEFEYVSLTDQFKGYVDIKCQGTSSMGYPKKNFTINLYEDKDLTIKIKKDFKKWGKQNKFCLKANWVDTTHTRNISGAKIAYDMVESRSESEFKTNLQKSPRNGAIDGFPIKVYLNGMFHGIYTWNIPKDAWMFGMDESNPNHMVLCAEVNNNGDMSMANSCQFRALWDGNDGAHWSIEVGTLSDSLKNSFNNAISHVMNSSDEDFKQNLGNYFDVNSLIDYYLFSYLTCHIDGLAKNMLMVTYDGIHWGACLYDMDSIYGANYDGNLTKPYNLACPDGYQENNSLLWQRIVTNFSAELYNRYNELRKNALSIGNIVSKVENINEIISDRDFTEEHGKWNLPALSDNTLPRFREFMNKRCEYVDKIIADMNPAPRPVESISIPSSFTIPTGSSTQLKVTYTPTNTNQKGVTWSISPDTYATIDAETGLITANSVGTCIVTATSITNPEASATCSLNIIEANHTVIDHITTNKTQYFDTGLLVTDTMKVETDVTILSDDNYDHVFGIGNRFKLQTTKSTLSVNKNYLESKIGVGVYKNVRHTYIMDMADSVNSLIVDGIGYPMSNTNAADTTSNDVNLLILGGYYNNVLEAGHVAVDLYRFKVYDNGELVRDYVPVLKDGSIPCLYDNVNGTYCEKVTGDDLTYTE